MASILMGAVTAMIMLIIGGGCFAFGYMAGIAKPSAVAEKEKPLPNEEQLRIAEGFTNLLNYANRHKNIGKE